MDGTPEQVCRAGRGSCRGHGRAPSAPLGAIVIALQVRRATAQKQYLKYFFWSPQGATAAEAGSGRRCRQVEELAQLALGPDEIGQGIAVEDFQASLQGLTDRRSERSEERRVGKECVRTCRARG